MLDRPLTSGSPEPHGRLPRLLWIAAVLLNVVIAGLAFMALSDSLARHRERARSTADNLTRVLREDLSGAFDRIDLALLSVRDEAGRQLAAGGIGGPALCAFIERLHSRLPELEAIHVADASREVRCGVGVDPAVLINTGDRDFFRRLEDDSKAGLVFFDPIIGRSSTLTIACARRLDGPDGVFAGVVYAVVAIDRLMEKLAGLDLGSRDSVALVSDRQVVVARYPAPGPGATQIGQTSPTPQFQVMLAQGLVEASYVANSPVDGDQRQFSVRKVGKYPFYIVVTMNLQGALANWRAEAAAVTALVVILALVTVLSGRMLAKAWARQAEAVQAAAQARDRLEERVSERTAELIETIEELGRAKDEAESAGRMKADFLARVSHELRTPLNPIKAFADLGLASDPPPDLRENLVEIGKAADTLEVMIGGLIDLTALDSCEPRREPVGPVALLEALVAELRPAAEAKGLALAGLAGPDLPETLDTDPELARLALVKVGENAVKFTDTGGITIRLFAAAGPSSPEVCYAIEDTGPGIAPDKIAQVTVGLTQGEAPLTRRHRGLGLGLATAQKALALLGGRLEVKSELGKGSVFTVCLPAGPA